MKLTIDLKQDILGDNSLENLTPEEIKDWSIAAGLLREYEENGIKKFRLNKGSQ
jgi:hypothetical protein